MTGTTVRRIRQRLGLTQAAFAKVVGVHSVTVSRWEHDVLAIREPTARYLRVLARGKPRTRPRRR